MGVLKPTAFLTALAALFSATRSKGSVYLTIKKVKRHPVRGGAKAQEKAMALGDETHILIRARTEKKRISTTVEEGEEAESFQAALALVLGGNVTGLMKEKKGKAAGGVSEMEVVVSEKEEEGEEEAPVSVVPSKGAGGGGGGGGKKKKRR